METSGGKKPRHKIAIEEVDGSSSSEEEEIQGTPK